MEKISIELNLEELKTLRKYLASEKFNRRNDIQIYEKSYNPYAHTVLEELKKDDEILTNICRKLYAVGVGEPHNEQIET